jgi:molybdopterin-synthase adenylyltransferase
MPFQNPHLPDCFLTWTEPPDASGDEVFRIVSWRRSLTLKGHSFREFSRSVIPLLNGSNSMDMICESVSDLFDRPDLEAALDMLGAQGLVVEAVNAEGDQPQRLHAQLAWLGEAAPEGRVAQRWLTGASVTVFGAGGPGASAARILAASGIGRLTLVDPAQVGSVDPYFSPLFRAADQGKNRAEVLAAVLGDIAPEVKITAHAKRPETQGDVAALIENADFVLCLLDSGELNLALKLNRACRAQGVRWLAGAMEGTELVIGPGFSGAADAPCYMCWRMREVACAANPEARFALERRLDKLRQDLSGRRENLAGGADIVGAMLACEVISVLSGAGEPALDGRFLVVEVPGLRQEKHTILRKPGCPVCGAPPEAQA